MRQPLTIERDEWLYVHTDTAKQAREFFGLPPDTPARLHRGTNGLFWAVLAPKQQGNKR